MFYELNVKYAEKFNNLVFQPNTNDKDDKLGLQSHTQVQL